VDGPSILVGERRRGVRVMQEMAAAKRFAVAEGLKNEEG
jgi:hypothetical protein